MSKGRLRIHRLPAIYHFLLLYVVVNFCFVMVVAGARPMFSFKARAGLPEAISIVKFTQVDFTMEITAAKCCEGWPG